MRKKHKGFTLIELLIVVAIIGILATIAVPNFMCAQVRARVARVGAELRNLSVAMEQYRMDQGTYPPFVVPNYHFIVLTTPVAYFSGLPNDIFDEGEQRPAVYGYIVENEGIGGSILHGNTVHSGGKIVPSKTIENAFANVEGALWIIQSKGPDTLFEGNLKTPPYQSYDPSNGCISGGDLWRSGP